MTNNTDQPPDSPATADETAADRGGRSAGASFPIVGVGASAGGLEAFTELLKALPPDTGMGFVLVQHLDPQHESALTQLLSRATTMPVREVENNLRVEADHVYIIPPNKNLGIAQGVLKLQPRQHTRTPNRSIDFFFESLAEDQRERAIGVILSGTATDGTLGLEAIKAEGGITFAQDRSARYDSMPRSAVAAGCVDFVLAPESIAQEIARIAKHPYVAGQADELLGPEEDRVSAMAHEDDETPLPSGGSGRPRTGGEEAHTEAARPEVRAADNGYKKVLLLLRAHSGVDFSLYKSPTIQRRITRRMVLNKQDTPADYAKFLRGNARELDALYSDALISVTSFFRNPEAFEVLQRKVFPDILLQRGDEPVRVWVLGCSTGQEAYSIAMAFVESVEKAPRLRKLQVFATDLNDALLEKARHGLYARSLANDISPERLQRFFVEEEGGYRVVKPLREMVVFARQNLISDPPFSRLDLISCRNLLIYLEPSVQKKVFPTFHYALKPEGFLLLGASESIGTFTDLFEPADKKHKIYSKKPAPTTALHLPIKSTRDTPPSSAPRPPARPTVDGRAEAEEGFRTELNPQREADRVTVNQFAPPGVLINAELQILQFRGPTGAYLEPPSGKASFDVLKMAREGLMLPLRATINQAKKGNKAARREQVQFNQDGKTRVVNVEVIPLKNLRERCFLILFEDAEKADGRADDSPPSTTPTESRQGPRASALTSKKEKSRRVTELERALSETRDYLQSIQEQYEAANEELQAANEEAQSGNEELQSINEELETSKEELESTNEELTTVNEEMENRNAELNRLNSDLVNLQTSTQLAIVLLARDLSIRRFSAQAEKQFKLLATDIGRAITEIRHNLALTDLDAFIGDVITQVREREREVQDKGGRWYSLRVRPYLTVDNKVDGAVLVLVDIDDLKQTGQALTEARDRAEAVIRTVPDPLLILHPDLRVHSANEAFYRVFKVAPAETVDRVVFELGNGQWDIPKLRQLLEDILPSNSFFDGFEITHDFTWIGRRSMLLNARMVNGVDGRPKFILLGIRDISQVIAFQADLRRSELRYRRLFEAANDGVLIIDPATRKILDANPYMVELLGYTREEFVEKELFEIGLLKDKAASRVAFEELHKKGFLRYEDLPLETKAGERREVELVCNLYAEEEEKLIQCNVRDITVRKQAEDALRESEERYRTLFDTAPMAVFVCDRNAVIQYYNRLAVELWGREPTCGAEQHCGSVQLWLPDGRPLPHAQSPMMEVLRTGQPALNVDMLIERPDGSRLPVLVNFAALRNARGEISGAITSFMDIAERKQAEEALRRIAADLSESDRRKTEFLATLAHELRNPLAPIRNAVQILRLKGGDRQVVELTSGMMERQVGQMVRLVDDLLDVSRISRGKIELRKEWIELASVLNQAAEAARSLIQVKDQELTVKLPPKPIHLNADATRLAQVVGNLLNNACKFTDRNGGISLTAERTGEVAVIRVRDNGIGIATDQLPHIFDMFMQIDTSLERSVSGLGIGLTLVKNLVELHGGAVEVHSAGIGQGTEFVIRLPIMGSTSPPPEPAVSQPITPPARRILVVDDNRDLAESLTLLLKLGGNETHTVHDGLEAVAAAATFKPDVILLDIGLPKLNGYEATRQIREQPWGKRIVIVALSGWGQEEDRRKAKEAGFDSHLVKPVHFADITKLLAELLPP